MCAYLRFNICEERGVKVGKEQCIDMYQNQYNEVMKVSKRIMESTSEN